MASANLQECQIHTDDAPEVVSYSQQQFCAPRQHCSQTIIPDHQFQNDKGGEYIGDIKRKPKTIMMASGVPEKFWGFPVQHATALQNVTGSESSKDNASVRDSISGLLL